MLDSTTKRCSKCGIEFPATSEYFGVHKLGKYGLRAICKSCKKEVDKTYSQENRENLLMYSREYALRHKPQTALRMRNWRENNPERDKINSEKYRASDTAKAYRRKWNSDNHDKTRSYSERFRKDNPERSKEISRDSYWRDVKRSRRRAEAYRIKNPNKVKMWNQRRRARVSNAEGSHSAYDIYLIFEQQEGYCFYCGSTLNDSWHLDHKTPLSEGGSNYPDNLCAACANCNLRKHTMSVEEWKERYL